MRRRLGPALLVACLASVRGFQLRPRAPRGTLVTMAASRRDSLAIGLAGLAGLAAPAVGAALPADLAAYKAPPYDPDLRLLGPDRAAFSLLPLAPGYRRKTVEAEVVPGEIWTHDQVLGVVNVNVPVRQIVVRLPPRTGEDQGGLLVYNPVGPTPELLRMMKRLEAEHGPVKYVALASVALEHKTTAALFSRNFPRATVFYEPGQWSFPVPIPLAFEGFSGQAFQGRLKPMPPRGEAPWSDVLDHKTLQPITFKSVGAYSETAMLHKASRTLLVTDCVVEVPLDAPAIIQDDPRAMLFHARDDPLDFVEDNPENRRKGWRRMAQFGLVFMPSLISVKSVGTALGDLRAMDKRMVALGEKAVPGGLYPWCWAKNDEEKFIKGYVGGPFVPPILQKLIYDREPDRVYAWAEDVAQWDFQRVVPCHLKNVIDAGPQEFLASFGFLQPDKAGPLGRLARRTPQPNEADLKLLTDASNLLTKVGVTAPSKVQ